MTNCLKPNLSKRNCPLSTRAYLKSVIGPLLFDLKFATTLLDHFFIKLMLHLSQVKQMYSQTIHLTHDLKSGIQIIRRRVDLTETPQGSMSAQRFEPCPSDQGS